jgi:hypothetical protein
LDGRSRPGFRLSVEQDHEDAQVQDRGDEETLPLVEAFHPRPLPNPWLPLNGQVTTPPIREANKSHKILHL